MKEYNVKDLITEPTTHGITYITREGSQWDHVGINRVSRNFPVQVDLELNTTCNLNCKMCFRRSRVPEKGNMPYTKVIEYLDEAAKNGAESVKLQYRGEPLLYPHFNDIINMAKNLGLYVHFNTNGTLLTKDIALALVRAEVDKVIFSVDGCYSKTYEAIRIGADFRKVEYNIDFLHRLRGNRKFPLIGIHAVIQDLNREEIENGDFEYYWKPWADEIAFMEEFDMVEGSVDNTPLPHWHCAQLWQRLIVLWDGKVVPCCGGIDYENGTVYSIGDSYKNTLKEIWNSQESQYLKALHTLGMSHLIAMCSRCRIRKNVVKKLEGKL